MNNIPYLIIAVAVLIILLGIAAIYLNKGEKREPDYRVMFILGITWLPLGIATENPGFWITGLVLFIVGLVNKKKWKKQPKWSELSANKKHFKLTMSILIGLVLLGLIAFYMVEKYQLLK